MPDRVYLSEALLRPVTPEQPAGRDLRFDPVFRDILEARRADEVTGKLPQWDLVADRSLAALQISKDLRLCCFLTEAAISLNGFTGLRDCVRLTREIVSRFWDLGLLPMIEDDDLDYRSGALAWFNDRMADAIRLIPVTSPTESGEGLSFARYLQAQRIGSEEGIQRLAGDKRETVSSLRQQGWITLDAFENAMKATKRAALEAVYIPFGEAHQQFLTFEQLVDEKFGPVAPSFKEARQTFDDLRFLLESALKKKQEEEGNRPVIRDPLLADSEQPAKTITGLWTTGMPAETGSWQQAEGLVRSGKVDQGLQQMAALAAQETSGRGRFLRKLMLVDVCKNAGRDRLARTILEELNKQIVDHKLEQWENTALVGAVWSRLYRLYKKSASSTSENEKADALYNQLCRLDPWQAYLDCED
jgi:type VI secretion system protein ImpA